LNKLYTSFSFILEIISSFNLNELKATKEANSPILFSSLISGRITPIVLKTVKSILYHIL